MAGRCRFGPGSSAENLITRWRYHNSRPVLGRWRHRGGGSANKITGWRNSIPGALRIANWTLRSWHEVQQQSEARVPGLLARRPAAAAGAGSRLRAQRFKVLLVPPCWRGFILQTGLSAGAVGGFQQNKQNVLPRQSERLEPGSHLL